MRKLKMIKILHLQEENLSPRDSKVLGENLLLLVQLELIMKAKQN